MFFPLIVDLEIDGIINSFGDGFEQRLNTHYGIREVEALLGQSIAIYDYLANCQRLTPQRHGPD